MAATFPASSGAALPRQRISDFDLDRRNRYPGHMGTESFAQEDRGPAQAAADIENTTAIFDLSTCDQFPY